ncbi:MAG: hypothetical protein JNG84_14670 [Archangium sp.]|nr:hypothetical protein [Archangium sp.]
MSRWSTAEHTSRRLTLSIGAGVLSYAGWSWALSYVFPLVPHDAVAEWPPGVLSGVLAGTQASWALLLLPLASWAFGRLFALEPWPHVLLAVIAGVGVDLALRSVTGAIELVLNDPVDLSARAVLLGLGGVVSARATAAGTRAALTPNAEAESVARANREAYAAKVAAEQRPPGD